MKQDDYTRWLAAEIQAAIDDPRPSIPHAEVMTGKEQVTCRGNPNNLWQQVRRGHPRMDAQLARLNADRSAEHTAQQTP